MQIKNKIAKRQSANREIIKLISEAVEANPDLRFNQILSMLGIADTMDMVEYFIESVDLLERIKNK